MTLVTFQPRVMLAVEDCSRKMAIRAEVASADSGSASVNLRRNQIDLVLIVDHSAGP